MTATSALNALQNLRDTFAHFRIIHKPNNTEEIVSHKLDLHG